jgi:cell division protein FtsI (penicillin-binding protein 3)
MGDVLRLENVMPDGMPQGAENLIVMHDSHPGRRCNSGLQGE